MHVNSWLTKIQKDMLFNALVKSSKSFAWDYTDMRAIHLSVCTHHIYTDPKMRPIHQPQRRLNLALKDLVKIEI